MTGGMRSFPKRRKRCRISWHMQRRKVRMRLLMRGAISPILKEVRRPEISERKVFPRLEKRLKKSLPAGKMETAAKILLRWSRRERRSEIQCLLERL